jgi:hypothetical protein
MKFITNIVITKVFSFIAQKFITKIMIIEVWFNIDYQDNDHKKI